MERTENRISWIETLPRPQTSEIIAIRHGESLYANSDVDLTEKGISQIQQTALCLETRLQNFDSVIIISSPAPRAISSANVFVDALKMVSPNIKTAQSIRPFEIKQLKQFLDYDSTHATEIYGQMWLTDPYLEDENPLVESRTSVENRASRFLYHYGRQIDRVAQNSQSTIGAIVFTHMEVGMHYLQGLYPDFSLFPITEAPALSNAEPVIIQLDNPQEDRYTIHARGNKSEVSYNPLTRTFQKYERT